MLDVTKRSQDLMEFGNAVRRLRIARGLSQEELADRVELHRTYVGGIERGERNPTLVTIRRIAEALEVPPWRLLRSEAER
jgi:transcriptional regulator with XRE-family HTH domain